MSQLSNAYMQLSTAVEKQSNWLVSACKKIHAGGVALVNKGKQAIQQAKDNREEKRKAVEAQRQAAEEAINKRRSEPQMASDNSGKTVLGLPPEYKFAAAESAEIEISNEETVFNEQTESYFQSDNIEGVAY